MKVSKKYYAWFWKRKHWSYLTRVDFDVVLWKCIPSLADDQFVLGDAPESNGTRISWVKCPTISLCILKVCSLAGGPGVRKLCTTKIRSGHDITSSHLSFGPCGPCVLVPPGSTRCDRSTSPFHPASCSSWVSNHESAIMSQPSWIRHHESATMSQPSWFIMTSAVKFASQQHLLAQQNTTWPADS